MGMVSEFKEFIMRGNVMDMAVGVVVGGAFSSIVTSLVNDIIMPVISLATGAVNFSDLFISLNGEKYASLAAAQEAGASVFAYGNFIQTVVNFLIIAFCIFMVVKGINKLKSPLRQLHRPQRSARSGKSEVNIEATKCAFCASELK